MLPNIEPVPWDARALGCSAWNVKQTDEDTLREASTLPGLIVARLPACEDKRILHRFGFYYVDTLIEPYCDSKRLRAFCDPRTSISSEFDLSIALELACSGFEHGRFYRDHSISRKVAGERYRNWLKDLILRDQVVGLFLEKRQAGFIALQNGYFKLHAVGQNYRSMGLAKYWWYLACIREIQRGCQEITSSVSTTNLPVVSLYASLGFRFRRATDIYHCYNKTAEVSDR
jgi:ribosomal protein S18 acetylase RimI-like enzyme